MSTTCKLHIVGTTSLDKTLFNKDNGIELVTNANDADYILVKSCTPYPKLLNKTIYVMREPPKESHVVYCYDRLDEFKLVVAYEPDPTKPNQIPFNPINYPNFPSVPGTSVIPNVRADIELKDRGIFFAGNRNVHIKDSYFVGSKNINNLRKLIGEYWLSNFKNNTIIGVGWQALGTTEPKPRNWHLDKMDRIKKSNADFVLALENTIYPNYMTEKIWDGLYSDKVTLYLGDLNVNRYIADDCFIDLKKYYDIESNKFDIEMLGDRIRSMSQEEYYHIIMNARKVRQMYAKDKKLHASNLTLEIIKKIKE